MFTTNTTMSGDVPSANIAGEFVTSGFFGGLPGDPDGGKTRVVTQNRGKSRDETRRDEKEEQRRAEKRTERQP